MLDRYVSGSYFNSLIFKKSLSFKKRERNEYFARMHSSSGTGLILKLVGTGTSIYKYILSFDRND